MKLRFLLIFQLLSFGLMAQTYIGKVIDEDKAPMIGVLLHIKGTSVFSISDQNGSFTFEYPNKDFILEASFIGTETQSVAVVNGVVPLIEMKSGLTLDEVVVTALGITRNKQALSSSVEEIDGRTLTQVPMTNLVNSLAGEVPGVQITNGSSGVGSASRIIIRGENSLGGNSQPLFVVDGVPISNTPFASDLTNNGALQEVDYGNGGSEISLDDIASISVLKGAGSAALYGSRASNGVILVTTKRGQNKKGLGISLSTSLTGESLLTLPRYQNVYGGGNNGQYSFVNGKGAGVNDGGLSSYGPRLDQGLLIAQFDSPSVDVNGNPVRGGDIFARQISSGVFTPITPTAWVSNPNNVRDFFQPGFTNQNNIAISNKWDSGAFRISYSNLRNNGILENTDLKRDGLAISIDQNLTSKLTFDAYVNYVNSRSKNRPNLGYGYENVLYGFNWTGRQFDTESMRDYWQNGREGIDRFDINYLWLTNPFFTLYENTNSFDKNRIFGNGALKYAFSDKLSLRLRTGIDQYNDSRVFRRAFGTNRNQFGSYREDEVKYFEINTDVLLSYNDKISDDVMFSIAAGANRFDQKTDYQFTQSSQLLLPGVYNLSNSRVPLIAKSQIFDKRINSVYGLGTISYKSSLYLDLTVRNDWSSTLPLDNNSFAYYSAGLSFIASNAWDLPSSISFLKLRFNSSSAGNDTDPYQLVNTYQFNQNYASSFQVTNESILKNANLRPVRTNALEAGADLYLFKSRLQLEVSVYQNTSIDQIIRRPISTASGFTNTIQNGGKVVTKGLELRLSGAVVKQKDFVWQSSVNFFTYRSRVAELPDGVNQFITGSAKFFQGNGGSNETFYIAKQDGRVGDMYGTGFVEIDGKVLHSNGVPVQDSKLKLLGNYNPDFAVGFNNKFSYKNLSINILVDWRHGGIVTSRIKALGSTSGVLEETLEGRDNGIVGEGVKNAGTSENPNYVTNDVNVPASTYYNAYYDRGNEASPIYSASYVKLRQVGIYYAFGPNVTKKLGIQSLKLGLIGSNLLLFTENPHFDPELNGVQETNYTYGVEDFSYPSTRSIGLSLKTDF